LQLKQFIFHSLSDLVGLHLDDLFMRVRHIVVKYD